MLSTDRQTNRQTDKLTNATKNITSFAKEVKRKTNQNLLAKEVINGCPIERHLWMSIKLIYHSLNLTIIELRAEGTVVVVIIKHKF